MKVLVELLRDYAAECANISGLEVRSHSIAGHQVDLCFAGPRWSNLLTKAIAHLTLAEPASGSSRSRLRVQLWDGAAQPRSRILRAYLTTLAGHWFQYSNPRGELLEADGLPVRAFYHPGPDILSVIDPEEDIAFYWKRDLSALPYYEVGSPMRTLLHTWMRKQEVQFLHAAAVGTASGGVLLAGKGGSGKTTSALACLDSCLRYAADDYCMIGFEENRIMVYSLYNTAKVKGEADLARFPRLAPWVWNEHRVGAEKALVFLQDHMPERLITEFPLRAILLPVVTNAAGSRVEPCAPREALFALAPSTMAQLPASGPEDMALSARLVREVPCYKFFVGRDLSAIPLTIAALLASFRSPSSSENASHLSPVNSATCPK